MAVLAPEKSKLAILLLLLAFWHKNEMAAIKGRFKSGTSMLEINSRFISSAKDRFIATVPWKKIVFYKGEKHKNVGNFDRFSRAINCTLYFFYTGLRPPLYPLAHAAAAQYPYSMLNADIAAWHHSAQMYQASALRPGSPYGLPINSSNLSPMSRFSPGLLGHPGLAAAAAASLSPGAAGQPPHGHSLPHHIKQDYEGRHSGNSEKDSPSKFELFLRKKCTLVRIRAKSFDVSYPSKCELSLYQTSIFDF